MAKVRDYAALAATIGRKKYGASRFAEMAAEGRERASEGKKKTWEPGGGKAFAAMVRTLKSNDKRGRVASRAMASARASAMKARAARKAGIRA